MNLQEKLNFKAYIDAEKLRSHLTRLNSLSPEEIDMIVKSYSLTRQHGAIQNN